ncbi:Protein kinase [Quillaja saponaria]|uniref:Protein kinase n=1 Tax=Quillaja saponaria TaxID=32244 RepID=A0AAD7L7F2_QUISA|nr:Protein kinase [Quillaja saponaria]
MWNGYRLMMDKDADNLVEEFVFDIDPSFLVDCRKLLIGERIGEGSHSTVYEGLFEMQPVAVKIIEPRTSEASRDLKENFEREVNLLARIEHENIVKFVGSTVEPYMMIITELMGGGTLQHYLRSISPARLDLDLSISFALDISRVMEYLHGHGIIHRDLKPGNILLSEDKKRVKLADFGLAREMVSGEMTCEAGTYRWMAPELFNREPTPKATKATKFYDHKADIYSFSIVLWTLLTNKIPFRGSYSIIAAFAMANNQRPSVDELPSDIIPLVESCWAADPRDRPEFVEITESLTTFFRNKCKPVIPPSDMIEIDNPRNTMELEESPSADTEKAESKVDNKSRKLKWSSLRFLKFFKLCKSCMSRRTQ